MNLAYEKKEYSAVVFDCDGVIFDSNGLKTKAFREVLSSYPSDVVDKFIQYHQVYGGISRYVKFRVFQTDFLHTEINESLIEEQIGNFGQVCRRLYKSAEFTPGCLDTLEYLARKYSLYVASGGAEDELREVFHDKGVANYFKLILGAPKKKNECVREIVKLEKSKHIVFVGDAKADMVAAHQEGLSFVFMSQFSDAKDEMLLETQQQGIPVINTLSELKRLL
ncbi:MAG TPA: HAD family hydrolase [Nitrospirae bacterium]|nr:HAD family hydrolase [Nitrospirota bacterium]HDZ62784.1 HAD family hydrolase [Nitrospirota bacterium]